ncbi:MAG: SIS domain-containing protein [Actinomycetes bacterium]
MTAVHEQVDQSAGAHLAHLEEALAKFDHCAEVADELGLMLFGALDAGGRVLAAGNGGSAAQAQHFTAELVGRYRGDRPAYSAICLNAETSTLTALGNDFGGDAVFARQVEAHGRPRDVFVAYSTSGRSPNVVHAALRARQLGLNVWVFGGEQPSPLSDLADRSVLVPSAHTGVIQELHLVATHILCAGFDRAWQKYESAVALDGGVTWGSR